MSCLPALLSALFHLQLMCATERNLAQLLSNSLNITPLNFCVLVRLRNNLKQVGLNYIWLNTSVEEETKKETRQENKAQGSKQCK